MEKPARRPAAPPVALDTGSPVDEGGQTRNLGSDSTRTPQRADPSNGTQPYVQTDVGRGAETNARTEVGTSLPAAKAAAAVKLNALGDYRLVKKLGAGGMGEVYKAHQVSLDRDVALKVLARNLSKDRVFVERFLREARLLARLDHPNIIRSFGVGEDKGYHFLAMEFIDGGTLEDWIRKLGKLSVADAVHVVLACARGLEHAHGLNLIHRDIKPGNVLLTKKGVVKIADLGLAKATDEDLSLTGSGVGAGTPYYMSPEQARDAKRVDHRSDIYALGCMLYCLVTGELPFKGTTHLEVIEAKEKGRFPPARRINGEVPERLDLIIDKTLAKDPAARYQGCTELIQDLEAMELAGATLSFVVTVGANAAAAPKPAPAPERPAAPARVEPAAPQAPQADLWYVKFRTPDKQWHNERLTTPQIQELISAPNFDLKAEISRHPSDGFRRIITYPEFAIALQSRLAKAKADQKNRQLKGIYKQIVKEDKTQKRWRWFGNLFRGFMGWVLGLACIAVAAVVGYILFLVGGALLAYLMKMFEGWFG